MVSNIFIARTPLQLFNCIEARDRFHAGEENVLILVFRKAVDLQLMQTLLDGNWNEVRPFHLTLFSRQAYPLLLWSLLRRHPVIGNVYLGLPKHLAAHVVNSVNPAEVVIIDDGNEILKIAAEIARSSAAPSGKVSLAGRLLGMKSSTAFCQRARFFTIYDLKDFFAAERIIRNDYRCFHAKLKELTYSDEVYFIGSNLLGTYVRDRERFRDYLLRIGRYYQGRELSYIPHRYEDVAWLETVGREAGFQVRKFDTILEAAFFTQGVIPRGVATFRSTAIDTLALIYNIDRVYFPIASEDLDSDASREEFRRIYDYYDALGIAAADY